MDELLLENLREKVKKLPLDPGVYIMRNKQGDVIYVGKAKHLRNRVGSYFRQIEKHLPKVYKMVQNVDDFDYIVTDSEFEALVLECSLIKLHDPKYNILLKDDKGFSYIKISAGEFPRITSEKQRMDDGALYLGPYTSGFVVNESVDAINRAFKLPTCTRKFPQDIGKGRACLNFHLKQCMGVCRGKISSPQYLETIETAVTYLRQGSNVTTELMEQKMHAYAENLEFEKAASMRDRIDAINRLTERQKVIFSKVPDQDVLAFVKDEKNCACSLIKFRQGRLIDKMDFLLGEAADLAEVRAEFLARYYQNNEIPPIIAIDGEVEDTALVENFLREIRGKKVEITIPKRGEQLKLVQMAVTNCAQGLSHSSSRTGKEIATLDELAKILGLEKTPKYIEAYDISNIGSQVIVAGMVVFEDGKPLRQAYKRFNIKEQDDTDDYGAMREIIGRRLNRYEAEKESGTGFGRLPDLILLDGGQGHVNTVQPVVDSFGLEIPLFGMVKDDKHRTRAISSDGGEISIASFRRVFSLITAIQDEVHRYAITYSREKHKKTSFELKLAKVPGMGPTRCRNLLKSFKTVKAIKEATVEELAAVEGMNKTVAQNVHNFYNAQE